MEPSDQCANIYSRKIIFEFETDIYINAAAVRQLHACARNLMKQLKVEQNQKYRITFRHTKRDTNDGWTPITMDDIQKEQGQ